MLLNIFPSLHDFTSSLQNSFLASVLSKTPYQNNARKLSDQASDNDESYNVPKERD